MPRIGSSGSGGASNSSGNVTGVQPTTVDSIARWADTTGTTIKNSPNTLVQDSGAIESAGFITNRQISGTVTVNSGESWIAPALNIVSGGMIILKADAQLIIL